jgi:hypothetical protein
LAVGLPLTFFFGLGYFCPEDESDKLLRNVGFSQDLQSAKSQKMTFITVIALKNLNPTYDFYHR